jgi:hypothetical protein
MSKTVSKTVSKSVSKTAATRPAHGRDASSAIDAP